MKNVLKIQIGERFFCLIEDNSSTSYLSAFEIDPNTGQLSNCGVSLGRVENLSDPEVYAKVKEKLASVLIR
ncbi:hypothetical protein [Spirosoma sp.]|uniref:hypothetical protein n=1 Tax=Spirosoma sp. TaxID=1899569 RepID=UPI0026231245|nr:hypothetical protein [Spirosoma sp.]MCX6212944.1 hypothetical protein [Spirosoma sp.]